MNTTKSRNSLKIKNLLLALFLSFSPVFLLAQILEFKQNPPSLKWREIQTHDFQLIYPEELESTAQKLSSQIEHLLTQVGQTYSIKPRKISIILQNQNLVSNGFVQMGPRKSEFFTTPPQDSEINDWLENLAIHELRHVVQIDKLTGYLKKPFFEQIGFALFGLILPSWFFEGDAVWTETEMTNGGRGRIPSWSISLRTNILENRNYSYQKNYMGSHQDRTAGFYQLGYYMVAEMRKNETTETYKALMNSMQKNPLRPFNLSASWKKLTGYTSKNWYDHVMKELKTSWTEQQSTRNWVAYPGLKENKKEGIPYDERSQQITELGEIIFLRSGGKHAPQIRILNPKTGEEKKIIDLGWQSNLHFGYNKGFLIWTEFRKNPRYDQQVYQVIMVHDQNTNKTSQKTKNSRYFSPSVHADSKLIAAIKIDESNKSFLTLLDLISGEVIHMLRAPEGVSLQYPSFHPTGNKIIMTGVSSQGMALFEADFHNSKTPTIIQKTIWIHQKLEKPQYTHDEILFKSHFNGIDNIYSWNPESKITTQLTEAQYGVFDPTYDPKSDRLYISQYQVNGYRLAYVDNPQPLRKIMDWKDSDTAYRFAYQKPLQRGLPLFKPEDVTTKNWESKPYNWIKNAINFHSLSVTGADMSDLLNQKLGLYWLSDDVLNNFQTRIGYAYDSEIHRATYSGSLTLQRYFPKFSLGYENRPRMAAFKMNSSNDQSPTPDSLIFGRWRENYSYLQVSVPLSLYRRNSFLSLGVSTKTSLTDRYGLDQESVKKRFINQIRFPMEYSVYLTQNIRMAPLDLAPRLGYHVSLNYRHIPFKNSIQGEHLSFRSRLYLPGILRNHSLALRFHAQHGWGAYQATNAIPMVSGYEQLKPTRVFNTLLTSYLMPISYPDWTLGALAYIDRIKGGVFADFENIQFKSGQFSPRTVGLDLRMDVNLFRYYLPKFELSGKLIYAQNSKGIPNSSSTAPKNWLFTYGLSYSY